VQVREDTSSNSTQVITGQRLLSGGSSVALVTLAGVTVQSTDPQSNNTVVCVVAAYSASAVSNGTVTVRANSGAVITAAGLWSYFVLERSLLWSPTGASKARVL
jgi:hypothetical protein